jgi:hypothetical protein
MARFNDPDDLIQSIFHSCGSSGPPGNRVLAGKKYREPVLLGEKGKEQGFYGFGADLLCPFCGGRFDFILIEFENNPDDTPLSWGEIDLEEFNVDLLRCPECGHRDLQPL